MMVGILKPFRVVSDAFLCVFPVRAAGWFSFSKLLAPLPLSGYLSFDTAMTNARSSCLRRETGKNRPKASRFLRRDDGKMVAGPVRRCPQRE